eukprot:scaffold7203_cov131-Cylindrotheca_fusiformis.AAC.1
MMQESKNQGFPQLSQGCHLQAGTLYSKLMSSSPSLCHPRRIRQQSNWDDYVIHFISFHFVSFGIMHHPSQGEYGGLSDVA